MSGAQDYFGSDAQQALLARGRATFDLLKDNPRFGYYGRTVGLIEGSEGDVEALKSLTQLQGNSNIARVPAAQVPALIAACKALGLAPVHYSRWVSGETALSTARDSVERCALPDGLSLHWLSPETPQEIRAAFAQTALSCGVLPPTLSALTGELRPGAACFALTQDGQVASLAASSAVALAGHPDETRECWWGMLSTREEWRGHSLSLLLGAHVMLRMHERYGFVRFMTGIEPGNRASEVISARSGLVATDEAIIGAADPALLPGGRMTK